MGANVSLMEMDINTKITQTTSKRLTSEINASTNIHCKNEQSIIDSVINCPVKFGAQTCKASAMMSYIGSNSLEDTTKQEIIDIASQVSNQEIKDIPIGVNSSTQRIKQKAVYDQRNEMMMALHTNCSVNIDAYNVQTLKNTTCKDKGSITFAAQSITADAMAKCGATQGGKSASLQGATKMIAQEATQKIDGPSILDLLLPFLILPLMLFLVPLALRKGFTAFKADEDPPTLMERISSTLLYLFVFYIILWWPGVGAWYFGIWPYGEPDNSGTCKDGVIPPNYDFASKFTTYDELCLLSNASPCTEKDQFFHYQCGLLSGKCDSSEPELLKDINRYKAYTKACAQMPKNSVAQCTGPGVYGIAIGKKYSGCTLCTVGNYAGGFVKDSVVKEDESCGDSIKASYTAFMANPSEEQDPTKGDANQCKEGEVDCYEDNEKFKKEFSDDCTDPSYQAAKRRASRYVARCNEINKHAVLKNDDTRTFSLEQQCSSKPQAFLRCDDKGRCHYLAQGCVWKGTGDRPEKVDGSNFNQFDCSGASTEAKRACTNDFTGCKDAFYLEDSAADTYAREQCEKKYNTWKARHTSGAIASGSILGVLLIIILVLAFLGRKNRNSKNMKIVPVDDS